MAKLGLLLQDFNLGWRMMGTLAIEAVIGIYARFGTQAAGAGASAQGNIARPIMLGKTKLRRLADAGARFHSKRFRFAANGGESWCDVSFVWGHGGALCCLRKNGGEVSAPASSPYVLMGSSVDARRLKALAAEPLLND